MDEAKQNAGGGGNELHHQLEVPSAKLDLIGYTGRWQHSLLLLGCCNDCGTCTSCVW
jgi:hypothetical protein